jgi:PKD repeat protein
MRRRAGVMPVGLAVGVVLLGLLPVASLRSASASGPPPSTLVAAVPSAATPNVLPGQFSDGTHYQVFAIAQVGSQIIMGGQFTSVIPTPGDTNSGHAIAVSNIVAFDQATGTVNQTFLPQFTGGSLDSQVDALLAGPVVAGDPTVYVGGSFKSVNGSAFPYLVLLDAINGTIVTSFVPKLDGGVNALKAVGSHLIAGGTFQHAQAQGSSVWILHQGLASLDPNSGALQDSYLQIQLTGHHYYTGTAWCTPTGVSPSGCTHVQSMDVTPDGTRLIVDGDFKNAADGTGSYLRDQIAMIDLGSSAATVDQGWATQEFDALCSSTFDSWIRNVAVSPDGSYFVVTSTGANGTNQDGTKGLCDAASRWEISAQGSNVQPTWVDWTGKDSLYSVAITSNAVYVGGHERWMNNSLGSDSASPGAVPRAGVAALDPVSGVPFAWNPGRTPRADGTYSLLATPQGLYAGSDTAYWGPGTGSSPPQYYRGMIAFFATGGEALPSTATASIPANIFLAGPGGGTSLTRQYYDGTTFGQASTVSDPAALNWSQVHGAFVIGNQLFYGYSDGNFYRRTFDGTTLGTPAALDPAVGSYDDPVWDGIYAGSNSYYQGKLPTFYGTSGDIATVTGMLYFNGRLYYSLAGKKHLYYRTFTPDTGIVGSDKCVWTSGSAANNLEPCVFDSVSSVDFSAIAGMALSASTNTLYYADSSGNLHTVAWNNGNPDTTTDHKISGPSMDGRNWKSQGMFLLAPGAPTASFTPTCSFLSCSLDASASTAPGSSIASYTWDFGDGSTPSTTTSPTTSYAYAAAGTYTITLTVTNAQGATATSSQQVTAVAPSGPVAAFTSSCTGLSCSFDGSSSSSPGSSITGYAWDFGDGDTATTVKPTETFPAAGTYTVSLTVTNALNQTGSITKQVTVAPGPVAAFSLSCSTMSCSFDGSASSSSGSTISTYAWNFGDGSSGVSGPSATTNYTYAAAGSYTVTLTVTDALGNTASISHQVSVAPAPTASFVASCNQMTCSMDGTGSTAPGSSIASYAWTFGDGNAGSGATTSDTYASSGVYTVTLTVTNALGSSASVSESVQPSPTTAPISWVGQAATSANALTETVTVPANVAAGNGLILIATSASNTAQTAPAGWTKVGTASNSSNLFSTIWQRVAVSTDPNSKVAVTFGTSQVKGTLQLLAYAGTSASGPVQSVAAKTGTTAVTVTTPTATVSASGVWVMSYWAARTSSVTGWTVPASQTVRGSATNSGGGYIISTATDGAGVVAPGTVGGLVGVMTPSSATASGDVAWTVVLAPSP